jgi:hypothetical protein
LENRDISNETAGYAILKRYLVLMLNCQAHFQHLSKMVTGNLALLKAIDLNYGIVFPADVGSKAY